MKNKLKTVLAVSTLLVASGSQAVNAFPKFRNPAVRTQVSSVSNFSGRKFFTSNFRSPNSSRLRFTIGGAVRSEDLCAIDSENSASITALVSTEDMALTTQSHPQLFVELPALSGDKIGDLIIKNESESYYQEVSVNIPAAGGNLAFNLPASAPGLEVGEDYSWFLKVQCGETAQVEDPLVMGTVSRVALDVPEFESVEAKVKYLADAGIWYDTLASANLLSAQGDSRYWDVLVSELDQ